MAALLQRIALRAEDQVRDGYHYSAFSDLYLPGDLQLRFIFNCAGKLFNLRPQYTKVPELYITQLTPKPRVRSCDMQPWDDEDAYKKA
jgi:hypothetical protein